MLRSTLSILALYNYRPDIFDDFSVPDGVQTDVLFPELLAQLAELEMLYSDPDTLKTLIAAWSKRKLYTWDKLYKTMLLEYDPIYNKDAYYEETEDRTLDSDNKQTRDLKSSASSTGNANTTDTHSVSGYNEEGFTPAHKDDASSTTSTNGSGTETGTVNNERDDTEKIERKRREYGNIGVTTTQHMIEEERAVADFDIYQYIINDFKDRFCLMVY